MITGGASGALRQEFRELELLDDICHLRYIGKLDGSVVGDRRQTLIHTFRTWKGENYVPVSVHKAIHWGKTDPFHTDEELEANTVRWQIIEKPKKTTQEKQKPTEMVLSSKRKAQQEPEHCKLPESFHESLGSPVKKSKISHIVNIPPSEHSTNPAVGTVWSENSCAYDCIISILYNTWLDDHENTSERWRSMNNDTLTALVDKFEACHAGSCSLESCRDQLRHVLCNRMPNLFVWGRYISLEAILYQLLHTNLT
jgi:hypothetical protein